jgi:hypothetical protein
VRRTLSILSVVGGLMCVLGGCAQLLGVDDVTWRGGDSAPIDALVDQTDASAPDAMFDAPTCDVPCTLVTQSGILPALATDGVSVFFRTADTVWSCPVTGCANATPVRTTSTTGLHAVSASTNLVVWSDGNAVLGCAPGACATPTTFVDFSPQPVTGLAASPTSSFVLASAGDGSSLAVHTITLVGQTDTNVFTGAPGGGAPGPVAAVPKSPHVYWSQVGVPTLYDCAQAQCASPADTKSILASPSALVATGSAVFAATGSGLVSATANLASTTTFANGAIAGVALSPNSTSRVYFASGTSVQSCATNASPPCTPTTHHTGSAISAIAADDVAVYWIEGTSVMRLVL